MNATVLWKFMRTELKLSCPPEHQQKSEHCEKFWNKSRAQDQS